MADKKVSELSSAQSINLSDLFLLTQDLGQGQFDSLNVQASLLATWLASQVQFPLLLTYTTATTLIGAINEIAQSGGGGGGGGSTVYLGTSAPSSATGSNADLYVQYTVGTPNTVDALYVKIAGAWSEISTGGGASSLSALSDVVLSSPSNGQVLKYNSTTNKWENANESGGGGSGNTFILHGDSSYMGTTETAADIIDAIEAGDVLLYMPYTTSSNKELYVCSEIRYSETSGDITSAFLSFINLTAQYAPQTMAISSVFVTVVASPDTVLTTEYENSTYDVGIGYATHNSLAAGNTSITFYITGDISAQSNIDVYTSVYGLNPTAVTPTIVSNKITEITLTFEAQQSAIEVGVRITRPFY